MADRHVAAFPGRSHRYVKGPRATVVPTRGGALVKMETKPVDEVTTADIKHAAKI